MGREGMDGGAGGTCWEVCWQRAGAGRAEGQEAEGEKRMVGEDAKKKGHGCYDVRRTMEPDLLPPSALIQDDPAAADSARRKIAPKSRLSRLFSFPSPRRVEEPPALTVTVLAPDSTPITLDSSSLEDVSTDRYEWAVLYENQRGSVLFSLLSRSISLSIHQAYRLLYTLLLQSITVAI